MCKGPCHRHRVTPVVTNDALGSARCSRRVQDVERISGAHGNTVVWREVSHHRVPINITFTEISVQLRSLPHDRVTRRMRTETDGFVDQGFVGNHAIRLKAAGSGHDDGGLRIINTSGKLRGSESTKHHRMNRP